MSGPFVRLWGAPLLVALFTAIGLLSALLGDGLWDALSAVMLATPALAALWGMARRPGS